ncbi:MAG: hypothetical protein J3Q66DRAFT_422369 [Benniella sp.]|nr:MAG: hypothetical protein J3Q66DRAFT_422369 [Benniella sp.]
MSLVKLTHNRMSESLIYISELECTVLEVKVIGGLGTTIDVVLSNGVLREGDRIVVCGLHGAIASSVSALKLAYFHHKEIKTAMGVKIALLIWKRPAGKCRLFGFVTPQISFLTSAPPSFVTQISPLSTSLLVAMVISELDETILRQLNLEVLSWSLDS